MCNVMVDQYVPRGYGHRVVPTRCGSTSYNGGVVMCEECEEKAERDYPQGWTYYPGDNCRHGVYVGGDNDCACFACEMGDDLNEDEEEEQEMNR